MFTLFYICLPPCVSFDFSFFESCSDLSMQLVKFAATGVCPGHEICGAWQRPEEAYVLRFLNVK